MYDNRPRLEVERQPIDTLLDLAFFGALAWLLVPILNSWPSLPDRIPTHFDAAGQPDAWGSKNTILVMPAIAMFCAGMFWLIGRYPHLHNFPFKIHEGNARWAYTTSTRLLRALRLLVTALFAVVAQAMLRGAEGGAPLPTALFYGIIAVSVALPLFALVYLLRGNQRFQEPAS